MIIAICVLLALDILLCARLGWHYIRERKGPGLRMLRLPVFVRDSQCAKCGKVVDDSIGSVEIHMHVELFKGEEVPVTLKLCRECVEDA